MKKTACLKLTEDNFVNYLNKTYYSWLGKVIGVRLGAPVENFSSERINELYGNKQGYLVDYGIFASDDDTNGPLFFVRSLLEKTDITAQDVGNTFLNYLQEYKGFFWWGGVGVSSEHTAYENLKNGIKAPASGSEQTNGIVIAEQIGGQIFSDCWGYVAGYNPEVAKHYASLASSVTHDKNGIQGAIFVSVAITLAYQRTNVIELIEETLEYLDSSMQYYQVCKDILNYYYNSPLDKDGCLAYIQQHYNYDIYPGVCHIIPNTALMIRAMCYGHNDFSETLELLNRSGWDTDCNCGNVGSIMGALCPIDEKWIKPINDIVNASSCIGYLNMQTISQSAYLFASLAAKINHINPTKYQHFFLPYATEGFFATNGELVVKDSCLVVKDEEIFKYAYYLPKNIYDARYDPSFSPILYPNDIIEFELYCPQKLSIEVFVCDCQQNEYHSEVFCLIGNQKISYQLPSKENMVINRFGLRQKQTELVEYQVLDYQIINSSKLEINFANYPIDYYYPRYAGDKLANIRGFVEHSGSYQITPTGLLVNCVDHSFISTGSINWQYYDCNIDFEMLKGDDFYFAFHVSGFKQFEAIGIHSNELIYRKYDNDEEKIQVIGSFFQPANARYLLTIQVKYHKINIVINSVNFELTCDGLANCGLVGFYSLDSSVFIINDFKLTCSI